MSKKVPEVGMIEEKALPEGWCILIREYEDDNFMLFSEPMLISGRDIWFLICNNRKVVMRGKLGTVEWSDEIQKLNELLQWAQKQTGWMGKLSGSED